MNLYTYCANDPVNFVDPEGLWEMQATLNILSQLAPQTAQGVRASLAEGYRVQGGAHPDPRNHRPGDYGETWPHLYKTKSKSPSVAGGTWLDPKLSNLDAALALAHEHDHWAHHDELVKVSTDRECIDKKPEFDFEKRAYLLQFELTKRALKKGMKPSRTFTDLYNNWRRNPASLDQHIRSQYNIRE